MNTFEKPTLIRTRASALVMTALLGLGSTAANAGFFFELPTQASHVTDVVSNLGGGVWSYEYTVFNDGTTGFDGEEGAFIVPIIVDWELPWFGDAGISLASIDSPFGWNFAIETIGVVNAATGWGGVAEWQAPGDDFYEGPDSPFTTVTEVLHWYTLDEDFGIYPIDFFEGPSSGPLSGFGFDAAFDETASPYQASWAALPVITGDPALPLGGIPASPNATGTVPPTVPEPATLALLAIGALGVGWSSSRKRKG